MKYCALMRKNEIHFNGATWHKVFYFFTRLRKNTAMHKNIIRIFKGIKLKYLFLNDLNYEYDHSEASTRMSVCLRFFEFGGLSCNLRFWAFFIWESCQWCLKKMNKFTHHWQLYISSLLKKNWGWNSYTRSDIDKLFYDIY